jgi:SAM-dependent methyltransferase
VTRSAYDPIAGLYDEWSRSVTEDVAFYVEEAVAAGGPIVELGVGTGRIAVPIAQAGVEVIGVDSSAGMLEVARARAKAAGVELDLREGDLRSPPVEGEVGLVIVPFRALLHLETDATRLEALGAIRGLLRPGGRLVFDVFTPSSDDIEATNGRWLEREPGIFERADWNERDRILVLDVRGPSGETTMRLAWLPAERWHALLEEAGFRVVASYGWFDRRPFTSGEDTVWVAERP